MTAKKFSLKERILLSKKLTYLLRGGMSLIESVSLMEEEQKKKKALYFKSIKRDLINGKTLHQSIGTKNVLFDMRCGHLIKIGEMTGSLPHMFEHIVLLLQKKREMRSKIQAALIYPSIIVISALILVVILLLYVFPQIISAFSSMNAALPLITRIFIAAAEYLRKYGIFVSCVLLLILFVSLIFLKKSRLFKLLCERVLFSHSIFRSQFQPFFLKEYCSVFGLLLGSGISITEASSIMEQTSQSILYARSCKKLGQHLLKGKKVSAFFMEHAHLFPVFLSSLIKVAEKTGNLSATFVYIAQMYEESADESLKRISSLIEPLLMIVIGLFVGLLALAIISPVYQLTSVISLK